MHGYQLINAVAERTEGAWSPSPGAIYPKLAHLEAEGLVSISNEGGRKLATLTDAGRLRAEAHKVAGTDPFLEFTKRNAGPNLRGLLHEVHSAARQVSLAGAPAQIEQAAEILSRTRRALYLLLAEEPKPSEYPEARDDLTEQ